MMWHRLQHCPNCVPLPTLITVIFAALAALAHTTDALPCKDDPGVIDAMECVKGYAKNEKCNWGHWSEMYETCKLWEVQIDGILLPLVKEGSKCTWSSFEKDIEAPVYDKLTEECEDFLTATTSSYVEVTSNNCKAHGYETLTLADECQIAAKSLGRKVTWGPHGGYMDVVTGCSARFSIDNTHLFFNPVGICDPNHAVGQWTHTSCQCTNWMPCLCREPSLVDSSVSSPPSTSPVHITASTSAPVQEPTSSNSASLVMEILAGFKTNMETCSKDGLSLASTIENDIIPYLKIVGPLQQQINMILDKFDTVYKKRKIIKKFAKFIPKVGKMILFVVEKIEALYLGLTALNKSLEELVPEEVEGAVEALEFVHNLLTKEVEGVGVGLAHQAGYIAIVADESKDHIESALQCSSEEKVNSFSDAILDEMILLGDAAKICTILPQAVRDLKLEFLGNLHIILDGVLDTIGPVIDQINDILDKITSTASEVACCTISPHLQAAGQAIASVIDYSTCFAGSIEGLLNDLLRELVPDASINESVSISGMPLSTFVFNGIDFNTQGNDDCRLSSNNIEVSRKATLDLAFSIQFNLHEALAIADDGGDLLDDIAQSCDPNNLINDIAGSWGGDCCCTARETVTPPGTFCLKFEAFFFPGSYEVAAAMTGLERCTCCEDGIYDDEGCKGETAYCGSERPPPKQVGDLCPSTVDCECGPNLDCGKRNYWDETYVCCENSFVPFGWTTDLCGDRKLGEACGTTEDDECVGNLECGKKDYWNENKYVCCEETFVPFGWTTDLCVRQNAGDSCGTTEDAECAGGMACARTTRGGDYKCCWGTYDCWPWTPNCDTGYQYCLTGEGFPYEVFVRTGDKSGAGTDANIEIKIIGKKGRTEWHTLNPHIDGNAFEKNDEDTAIVWDKTDVGEVTHIQLKRDNAGFGPGWYLESIGIGRTKFAVFNSWIDPYQVYGKQLGGPPRNYKIKVHTGTSSGAGTDSNVDFTMYGTGGSIRVILNPLISGNAFENGDYDVVYLNKYQDIGHINHVRICTDGRYAGSGWRLDWVEIDDRRANFYVWLDGNCAGRWM